MQKFLSGFLSGQLIGHSRFLGMPDFWAHQIFGGVSLWCRNVYYIAHLCTYCADLWHIIP